MQINLVNNRENFAVNYGVGVTAVFTGIYCLATLYSAALC